MRALGSLGDGLDRPRFVILESPSELIRDLELLGPGAAAGMTVHQDAHSAADLRVDKRSNRLGRSRLGALAIRTSDCAFDWVW